MVHIGKIFSSHLVLIWEQVIYGKVDLRPKWQSCFVRYVKIVKKKQKKNKNMFHEAMAIGAFCFSKIKRTCSTAIIDPGYFPHSAWGGSNSSTCCCCSSSIEYFLGELLTVSVVDVSIKEPPIISVEPLLAEKHKKIFFLN